MVRWLWNWRPDLTVHPAGHMTWEIRSLSTRGHDWLEKELDNGDVVLLSHYEALDLCFKAIRDGLRVCSDPGDTGPQSPQHKP